MQLRRPLSRLFARGKAKKDKALWQEYDIFRKDYRMPNYFGGRIAEEEVMDDYFTPEILTSFFKGVESSMNNNRITNPKSLEDKKKLGESMIHAQYYHVRCV